MYKCIVWATDASLEADEALTEALALLDPSGTLVAFHCDQRFSGGRVGGASVFPDEDDRRRHIHEQVEELARTGVDIIERIEPSHGSPAHEIAKIAEELSVDAIVCGTRARHGLPAMLEGSVAARLLKHATVPVIIVPTGAREPVAV